MTLSKRSKQSVIVRLAAASVLTLLAAGCQSANPANNGTGPLSATGLEAEIAANGPQQSYLQNAKGSSGADPADIGDSSPEAAYANAAGAADGGQQERSGNWNAEKPLLHGISFGDSIADIRKRHGKEQDSYTLEESGGSIRVLDYEGFSVGFSDKDALRFVEVFGSGMRTGVNGLKIGDHPDKALQELGKPSKQTDYLIAYEATGGLLKLDVDPKRNEIVSVKLLAQQG